MERAEIAWTRQLRLWWRHYNREYADGALCEPNLHLSAAERELGAWDAERREIRIARAHVARDPWIEVMGTLRHEMAHQYAHEVLGAGGEAPHGPAFRRACRVLRADPAPRAGAAAPAAGDDPVAALTRRVSKLLALGASPNRHEAEAAVALARRLMLQHNLDWVAADEARAFSARRLGPVRKRHPAWTKRLGNLLEESFFVEIVWGPDYDASEDLAGSALLAYGTPENLELAEYVHGYLSAVLPDLWRAHRRASGLKGDTGRMDFFDGVLAGFAAKLRDESRRTAAQDPALIWRGDPRLSEYFRWHQPRLRTTYGSGRRHATFADGQAAGRGLHLRRPLGPGGAHRPGAPLGLPPGPRASTPS